MNQIERKISGKPRPRLSREKRTSDILLAAEAVLEEFGYEHAPVAEVARRAGVVEGTVYHYFETKRDLYVAVAEAWYNRVLQQAPALSNRGNVFENLRELILRELFVIRANPAVVRFILMEIRPHPNYRNTKLFAMSRKFTSEITKVLNDGKESGELVSSLSIRDARDMIFGGIEHRTWAFLRSEGDFDAERAAQSISSIIYNGLKNSNGGSPAPPESNLAQRVERLEEAILNLKNSGN